MSSDCSADEKREYLQVGCKLQASAGWVLGIRYQLHAALHRQREFPAGACGVGVALLFGRHAYASCACLSAYLSSQPSLLSPSTLQRLLAEGRGFKAYWRSLPAERRAALAEEPAAAVLKVGSLGGAAIAQCRAAGALLSPHQLCARICRSEEDVSNINHPFPPTHPVYCHCRAWSSASSTRRR